ncbi:MAG: T9SS type A sorting domain-containing protein [Fimbriimonadaceae bacterium]|nr:T9SS type A sorting domain-containing protein [Chitinophagales bacterium]
MKKLLLIVLVLAGIQSYAQSGYRTRAEDEANPELDNLNGVQPDDISDFSDFGTSIPSSPALNTGSESFETDDTSVSGHIKGSIEADPRSLSEIVLNIYPNPASEFLIVKLIEEYPVNVSFINLVGQTVYSISISNKENYIDIAALEQGIYFVGFESGGEKIVKKIKVVD